MGTVVGGILICLIVLCIRLYNEKATLQQKIDLYKPMIETTEGIRDILYYCEVYPKLKYLYLSPSLESNLGPNILQKHLENPDLIFDIVHPDDIDILRKKQSGTLNFDKPIKLRFKNHLGEYIWFEEYATPVYKDGKIIAVQGVYRNVHSNYILQEQLEYKSTHDGLTGLCNREYFQLKKKEFDQISIPISVIVADLDDLKEVNDEYGHQMGDRLIVAAADCLKKFADEEMIVARIGGDEFIVVMPHKNSFEVEQYIEKVRLEMKEFSNLSPFSPIQISMGYEYAPSSYGVMRQLLNKADQKMYKNKKMKKMLVENR
ncbi:sensor domain-containing diguanylate cyclase [Solibacillus sp. FSL W7-1436]|uniref:sensor domain-containing diguanylate cyclase n=1 Tax=Solibacillus sp. FSL W7-1436 TaxID=2921705 RepID=UPI0030FAAFD8